MGSIELPTTGHIYLDTQILIYSLERHPQYEPLLDQFWLSVAKGGIVPMSSALLITEVMVMPLRRNDSHLISSYELALFSSDLQLIPLSKHILYRAAKLRAEYPGARTPDALHAASALEVGCTLFLTNDHGFRRISELPVAILDDFLAN